MTTRRNYSRDTWTEQCLPWGTFTRARAICPDGIARVVRLEACADTFFSVPARLSYRGKTVSGFISFTSDSGLSTDPEQWVKFAPTGKHKDIFAQKGG
jgi:hypothetical protein